MSDHELARDLYDRGRQLARKWEMTRACALFEEAAEAVDPRRDFLLYARIVNDLADDLAVHFQDSDAAVTWLTRLLALADKPQMRDELGDRQTIYQLTLAHILFANHARGTHKVHVSHILDVLDACDALLEQHGYEHWKDTTMASRAKIIFDLGREDEAIEMMREAVRLGDEHGHSSPGTYHHRKQIEWMRLLYWAQRYDEAEGVARDLIADSDAALWIKVEAHNKLGHLLLKTDADPHEALRIAERGAELSEQYGEGRSWALIGLLFDAVEKVGQYDRALEIAEKLRRRAERIDNDSAWRGAYHALAAAHINLGDLEQAEPYLEKAETLARKLDASTEQTIVQDEVAEVRARFEAKRAGA